MSERTHFLHKFLSRLDKVDKKALEQYLLALADEAVGLTELLDKLPVGVLSFGRDGVIRYANPQAAAWLGLPASGRAGRSMTLDDIADSSMRSLLAVRPASARRRPVQEIKILAPKEVFLRLLFLFPEKQTLGENAVILVNVSSEKAYETERQRLLRHESLLRLGAGVAHEIGNPLNAIDIHLNLLKREAADLPAPRQKNILKTVEILQGETRRLDGIVRNFLKAVRKPPLHPRMEDLHEIVRESIEFFRPEMAQRGVRVTFRPDPGLEPFLMDRGRMREVFDNLLKNAMDAMPEGGPISVSISHKAAVVMVRIRDRGTGIRDEDLPRIFEAYYTTKQQGSGLGLMIVHNAVAEHGGRIEVETKPGRGTSFSILLPARRPNLQLPQPESGAARVVPSRARENG